jgi:hypothetical protein
MKFYDIYLADKPYQQITLAQGSAPIAFVKRGDGFALIYIGESILQTATTEAGAFMIKTGDEIPDDVRVLPVMHPLTGQPMPPNARYVATVDDRHLVLGNPRTSGLIV